MGCCGSSNSHSKPRVDINQNLSPLDLLKIRLVNGEISIEEYEKLKAVVQE